MIAEHDPLWWCCTHTFEGQRCSRPGTVSRSTMGPHAWLCFDHAFGHPPPRERGPMPAMPRARGALKVGAAVAGFLKPKP